jgi:hypothetical protein
MQEEDLAEYRANAHRNEASDSEFEYLPQMMPCLSLHSQILRSVTPMPSAHEALRSRAIYLQQGCVV